jgi:drug/metabolite transporter (DMT)-like permease
LTPSRSAIVLVAASVAAFAVFDTGIKLVTMAAPIAVVIWARYVFQCMISGATLLPRHGTRLLRTQQPYLQALRGALLMLSTIFSVLSLHAMPVGEVTAIGLLTPLAITAVASRTSADPARMRHWLLLLGGLAGALIVIRPDHAALRPAMFLPLAMVASNAAFQILTSRLVRTESVATTHFYTGLAGACLASLALPFAWQTLGPTVWLLMAFLGLFVSIGHYLLAVAYTRVRPVELTPFLYFQIIFATLAGWVVFGDVPGPWAWVGIAMITGCGLAGTRPDALRGVARTAPQPFARAVAPGDS